MALCNGGAGPAHHKDNQDCHVAMDETTNFSDTKALQEMKATRYVEKWASFVLPVLQIRCVVTCASRQR